MREQLPADFFRRAGDDDDEVFYSVPRLVVHLGDGAIAMAGGMIEPAIGSQSFSSQVFIATRQQARWRAGGTA